MAIFDEDGREAVGAPFPVSKSSNTGTFRFYADPPACVGPVDHNFELAPGIMRAVCTRCGVQRTPEGRYV